MAGIYFFLVSLCVVPYALPAMVPTWRWLLGVTLAIGGVISAIWIQDWIAMSNPDYHEGAGGALGRLFFGLVTLGFFAGIVIRTVTLILRSRGLPIRYGATILGSAIVPGSLAGIDAWQNWKLRPPSQACLSARFNVKVANASFVIPAAGFFNVYLGKTSSSDAYYFAMSTTLRAFCALSDHGKQPTKATLISLRFGQSQSIRSLPSICAGPAADWAATYCAAYGASGSRNDSIAFPTDIHVFAPDEFNLGEFGGSRSTYAESLVPKTWPGAPAYVQSDTLTADRHPLTFECSGTGNERWCKTSYPWRDGANLSYTFRVGYDDAAEKGKRIDAETRKFLAGFQATP